MSRDNVEIVRRIHTAFAERDGVTRFAHYAPDIEWENPHRQPVGVPTVYRGHDGVHEVFHDLLQAFREFEFRPLAFTPVGDHVLKTSGRDTGRAMSENLPLNRWRAARRVTGWTAVTVAVALSGCGNGARTDSQRLIEQARRRAKYAVEHLHVNCASKPGRVALRSTTRGGAEESETVELCVEPKHALRAVERRAPCPAGQRPRVDLAHRRFDCVHKE